MKLSQYSHLSRLLMLLSCSLILVVILAACGGGSTATTTSTPTPTVKPSPTPSPTPAVSFTAYKDVGYTFNRPINWQEIPTSNGVSFRDATGQSNFTIVVGTDPNGIASASTFLNAEVDGVQKGMTHPQTITVAPTIAIGGDSWVQKSITGTVTSGGQSAVIQIVFACDVHPANTSSSRSFSIFYGSPQSSFASFNTAYFQPMLQSFKFTS